MAEFEDIFEDIRVKLDSDNEIREELIKLVRKSVQYSSIAIRNLHRRENEKGYDLIQKNSTLITKINELANTMHTFPFGLILTCNQEYAESIFLYYFLNQKSFPTYSDLNIPYIAYIHGISDFIGELRRVILDSLRVEDEIDIAIKSLNLMDDLYSMLITLDYPDGLTYNLRKKTDIVRNLLEKTRGDVTLALNRISLIEKFSNQLKKYFPQDNK